MATHEYDRETLGDYIADVVDAATGLAERAASAAVSLADQAVRDAREVATSFESLLDAAAREGFDRAREAVRRTKDVVDEAAERARSEHSGGSSEARP